MNLELFLVAMMIGLEFLGWFTCYLITEFRYLWCKGKCEKCRNWKCKFFETDFGELQSYYYELCEDYILAVQEIAELKNDK